MSLTSALETFAQNAVLIATPFMPMNEPTHPNGSYHADAIEETQASIAENHARETKLHAADAAGHSAGRISREANNARYATDAAYTSGQNNASNVGRAAQIQAVQETFQQNFYYQEPDATYQSYGENAYRPWDYVARADSLKEWNENYQRHLSGWGAEDSITLDGAQKLAGNVHDGITKNENGDWVNADGDILTPEELEAMQSTGEFSSAFETNSPETIANYDAKLDGIKDLENAHANGEITNFADIPPQVMDRLNDQLEADGDTLEGKTFADIEGRLGDVIDDYKSETQQMQFNAQKRIDFRDPNIDLTAPPLGGPVVDAAPDAADKVAGPAAVESNTMTSTDGPAVAVDPETGEPTTAKMTSDFGAAAENTQTADVDPSLTPTPAPVYQQNMVM